MASPGRNVVWDGVGRLDYCDAGFPRGLSGLLAGHQARDGALVLRDDDFLPALHEVEEGGQRGLGLVRADGLCHGHAYKLVYDWSFYKTWLSPSS